MPESAQSVKTLVVTTCHEAMGQIKRTLNTDSIDVQFAVLWKGMELPFEEKLEQKPCGNIESLKL